MNTRAPADPLAAVQQLLAGGQAQRAGPLLDDALRRLPRSAEVQRLAAVAALMRQAPAAALAHATRALALAPGRADLHLLLGRAHKAAGDLASAVDAYRAAIARDAGLADAHVSLGIALKAQGRLSDAIACYRAALAVEPAHAAAHANLGNALFAQAASGEADAAAADAAAIEAQRRAAALDPANALVRRNLGVLLEKSGRRQEAVEHYNAALGLDPQDREGLIALANCLVRLEWYEGARACLERWRGEHPDDPVATNNLATVLLRMNQLDRAWAVSLDAQRLAPDHPEVWHNAAMLMLQRLEQPAAVQVLERIATEHPAFLLAQTGAMMSRNYVEEDPARALDLHRRLGARIAPAAPPVPLARRPLAGRRLRVGFVSGDLRRHSVAYFIEPLLAHLDRTRLETWAYHNARISDEVSARLRSHVDHWVPCAEMDDAALLARIRADAVDLLVDLSGHTAEARLGVFAARAAPLQATYLGYPTTTGVASIDLRLSDDTIDPPGHEAHNSERVLRLPGGMFCYRPDHDADPGEPPLRRNGFVTFGSFNVMAKVGEATLAQWAAALHRVPRSRLFLKTRALDQPGTCDALRRRLAALDIAPERLLLNPWRPDLGSHLELYREIDIALDTFPYNGATTSCEALWMGVPVLTRRGATHPARMGASLLTAIGRPQWIADDIEGFAARAAALAADGDALAAFRRGARAELRASALMDEAARAADFGRLLLQAWEAAP